MPYLPPAALCAVAAAFALSSCQGKAPADQAEAQVDPAIAAAVAETRAGPAFAITPVADPTVPAAPPSTLGVPTQEGFRSTFKIADPTPAPPAPSAGEPAAEAGED